MPRQSAPQSVPGPRALPAVLVVCQDGETSRHFRGPEGLVLMGVGVAFLRSLRGDPEEPGRGWVAEGWRDRRGAWGQCPGRPSLGVGGLGPRGTRTDSLGSVRGCGAVCPRAPAQRFCAWPSARTSWSPSPGRRVREQRPAQLCPAPGCGPEALSCPPQGLSRDSAKRLRFVPGVVYADGTCGCFSSRAVALGWAH